MKQGEIKKNISGMMEMSPMAPAGGTCCPSTLSAQLSLPSLDQSFVVGSLETPVGKVPQVSSALQWVDRWGGYKVRWEVRRMHYSVEPGLYALGQPDHSSPVLVTANYKMSFYWLQQALPNRNGRIPVGDTKGINVWCAAG